MPTPLPNTATGFSYNGGDAIASMPTVDGGRPDDSLVEGGQYKEGDAERIISGMLEENLARLQTHLIRVGMLSGGKYGQPDTATVNAMTELLRIADRRGERWQNTLEWVRMQQAAADGVADGQARLAEERAKAANVYLAPDYGDLSQQVKGLFRDRLKRDPSDAELALLADELMSRHRQNFDSKVGAVEDANAGAGRIVEPAVSSTNAAELFEQRFSGELEEVKDTEDRQDQTAIGSAILDSFGRIGMGSSQ